MPFSKAQIDNIYERYAEAFGHDPLAEEGVNVMAMTPQQRGQITLLKSLALDRGSPVTRDEVAGLNLPRGVQRDPDGAVWLQ